LDVRLDLISHSRRLPGGGDPKKVSHVISLVLLCAIPMLILEPLIAKAVGMLPAVTEAWIGGTIHTTQGL
jgi:uncharacterized membrane protein YadS